MLDQTRADYAAEGKTYTATPGELLVERMVKELKRPGRAGGCLPGQARGRVLGLR